MARRPVFFRCNDCDHVMLETAIVRATVKHPKDPATQIYLNQCPECGECQNFTNVCDEPGCEAEATCGWPTPTGYRRTCGKHMSK
jgi:hypothetical protein